MTWNNRDTIAETVSFLDDVLTVIDSLLIVPILPLERQNNILTFFFHPHSLLSWPDQNHQFSLPYHHLGRDSQV